MEELEPFSSGSGGGPGGQAAEATPALDLSTRTLLQVFAPCVGPYILSPTMDLDKRIVLLGRREMVQCWSNVDRRLINKHILLIGGVPSKGDELNEPPLLRGHPMNELGVYGAREAR